MKREKNVSYCYEKGSAKLQRVIIITILKYLGPRLYHIVSYVTDEGAIIMHCVRCILTLH